MHTSNEATTPFTESLCYDFDRCRIRNLELNDSIVVGFWFLLLFNICFSILFLSPTCLHSMQSSKLHAELKGEASGRKKIFAQLELTASFSFLCIPFAKFLTVLVRNRFSLCVAWHVALAAFCHLSPSGQTSLTAVHAEFNLQRGHIRRSQPLCHCFAIAKYRSWTNEVCKASKSAQSNCPTRPKQVSHRLRQVLAMYYCRVDCHRNFRTIATHTSQHSVLAIGRIVISICLITAHKTERKLWKSCSFTPTRAGHVWRRPHKTRDDELKQTISMDQMECSHAVCCCVAIAFSNMDLVLSLSARCVDNKLHADDVRRRFNWLFVLMWRS